MGAEARNDFLSSRSSGAGLLIEHRVPGHARDNLKEALSLFYETADPSEVQARLHEEVYVTRLAVAVG